MLIECMGDFETGSPARGDYISGGRFILSLRVISSSISSESDRLLARFTRARNESHW
jgi:hypothetical protein